jgi:small subunit ribosomal protein S16
MVRLRLTRTGRRHKAYWRIAAFDSRTRRDGKPIEYLGSYDPHQANEQEKADLKRDRVEYWLSKGAQPTETVASILRKEGIEV